MNIELSCGNCSASLIVDLATDEYEEGLWSLVNRFCNAHVVCGFVTPVAQDDSEKDLRTANIPVKKSMGKRILKSTDLVQDDESE